MRDVIGRGYALILLVSLLACGASQHDRTVKATLLATNAARDGFVAFDAQQQQKIVDAAASREAGTTALAAYRAERAKVLDLFEAAYRAISTAAVLRDDKSLPALLDAARKLNEALQTLVLPSLQPPLPTVVP